MSANRMFEEFHGTINYQHSQTLLFYAKLNIFD